MMLDPGKITFRKISWPDLPLMHAWFKTEFVMEWWSKEGHLSYEEVVRWRMIRKERSPGTPFVRGGCGEIRSSHHRAGTHSPFH